ncbi:hypothetical protein [Nonomuraea sp. NPDC049695]|uniref:hypothetical protein n=1 Tax=Nonomuraea sp. NPDC049695 TaxID=3154734 RepID=UPI00341D31A3
MLSNFDSWPTWHQLMFGLAAVAGAAAMALPDGRHLQKIRFSAWPSKKITY